MTAKKSRAKKTVADVVEEQEVTFEDVKDIVLPALVPTFEANIAELSAVGPDYQVTEAGDIVLTSTGAPIPEDHPVHPVHRAIAAARKGKQ